MAQRSRSGLRPVTYYFSPFGRDNNNCQTPSTACQTIAKANGMRFSPGDHILFQGGSFTGCLVFSYASNVPVSVPSNPIVIGSYGTGNATILSDCPRVNSGGYGPKSRAVDLNGVSATVQDLVISANGTKTQYGILIHLHRATLWVLFRNKCIVALVAVVAVGMWATLFALSIMSTAIRLRQRVGDEI